MPSKEALFQFSLAARKIEKKSLSHCLGMNYYVILCHYVTFFKVHIRALFQNHRNESILIVERNHAII